MSKRVCLITGATSGLGKSLAIKLSDHGYRLILVSKSRNKLKSLLKLISGNNHKIFKVDLSSLKEVKKFVKKISKIDILINNAGGFYYSNNLSKKTIFLNYYIPYFLMKKLVLNKGCKNKIIINISSNAALRSNINLKDINNLEKFNGWEIYKFSKLLLVSMTNYFSKINNKNKFISFNPGRMSTNFGSNNFFFLKKLSQIYLFIFGKNPNYAADEIIKIIKKPFKRSHLKINLSNFSKVFLTNFQKKLIKKTNKVLKLKIIV